MGIRKNIIDNLDRFFSIIELKYYAKRLNHIHIKSPIFVIGAPRSGTTVFERVLANHPKLAYFNHSTILFPRSRIIGDRILQTIQFDKHYLKRSLGKMAYAGRYKYMTPVRVPREGNFVFALVLPRGIHDYYDNNDYTRVKRELLYSLIKAQLFQQTAEKFFNKNPQHSVRLRLLNELFPDAKYIHIIRDGKAVAYSMYRIIMNSIIPDKTIFGPRPKNWKDLLELPPLLRCAEQWVRIIHHIIEDSASFSDRILHISYENFIENPMNICLKAWEFSELDIDHDSIIYLEDYCKNLFLENKNYKYKESLSRNEIRELDKILKPGIELYHEILCI